jgi:hypothetical protein
MSEKSPVYILKVDGSAEYLEDRNVTLKEAQDAVGGPVEPVYLPKGQLMLADEEGLLKSKTVNTVASLLANRPIVGDVIIMPTEYFD